MYRSLCSVQLIAPTEPINVPMIERRTCLITIYYIIIPQPHKHSVTPIDHRTPPLNDSLLPTLQTFRLLARLCRCFLLRSRILQ